MAIEQMKNGTFKINVYMGAGFSRYVAYASTRQEAQILELEAKLRKQKGETKRKVGDYTFQEVYEIWWKKKYTVTRHHEPETLETAESRFRLHILPHLGKKKVKKISFDDLESLQILWAFGDEKKGIKPFADFRKLISYMKSVMKYALLKKYIKSNPCDFLETPVNEALKRKQEEERSSKYYSVETIQTALELMKLEYGMKAYVLLKLLYNLGASKGEIIPLSWFDIDFTNKTITLTHKLTKNPKTGKIERIRGMKNNYRFRSVPVSDEILMLLEDWKAHQKIELGRLGSKQTPEQLLFTQTTKTGETNQPLHTTWLNQRLKALTKKHGIAHIKPHGFRHTFVSDMMNHGVHSLIVKSIVGHAATSKVTEEVYGHVSQQSKVNALSAVEEYRNNSRHQTCHHEPTSFEQQIQ